jgi:acetyl/propionyl-CoA carboxylase alpha subunit
MLAAVLDDPDGLGNELSSLVSSTPFEQASAFAGTRHNSLMSSMLFKVVKSLPAMRSIRRRPRAASRRSRTRSSSRLDSSLKAEVAGVVADVSCKPGETVRAGRRLVLIEPQAGA